MSRKYISVADTAKLVRSALKESFPGVKFSVRSHSYAGGASINVRYTDGPAPALVEAVAGAFAGSYFDGSIDYKGVCSHRLDGASVRFQADFIFVNRDLSDELRARLVRRVAKRYGIEILSEDAELAAELRRDNLEGVFTGRLEDYHTLQALARDGQVLLSRYSDRLAPEPSATLARVKFDGDDGYGEGTVGKDLVARQARAEFRVIDGGLRS